ncbi:hypothetical protein KCU73_g6893, partial [Aureobasidium melanogenum]
MGGHSRSDNKGPTLLILTCILTSLAIITTGLRCWVRWGNRQLGFDDGAMVLTTGLAVARMCIQIVSVRYGNGKHRDFVSEHEYQTINMLTCTELLLGIIAANLALSRSIYKYFTERARTLTSNASGSRTTRLRNSFATPTRMGYVKSPEPLSVIETAGSPRSEASVIPLQPYKNEARLTGVDDLEKEM